MKKNDHHLKWAFGTGHNRLIRLLGLLSPLAVRLLQVRDLSRQASERPAHSVIEPETLTVLVAHVGLSDRGCAHGVAPFPSR
jgi:hypothetical protein